MYKIIPQSSDQPRRGLAILPPSSPLDVYFDIEGFPLVDQGLEYLFGAVHVEGGKSQFVDWWAHDSQEEKATFEKFIDWTHARWKADPAMHVYHYAAYEVSALRRLMGRHATREDQVDDLLRAGVFVDLYQVVRQGLRVGEGSYSIKYIEHLYRPLRQGAVATAGQSIVEYARWIENEEPRDWNQSPLLKGIRDYNRDDCESILQLAGWLREHQAKAGITYLPPKAAAKAEAPPDPEKEVYLAELLRLVDSLDKKAVESKGTGDEIIHGLFRDLIGFYRREEKPVWWRLFEREAMTHQELKDDIACIGEANLISTVGTKVARSWVFHYRFDPTQDTKLAVGNEVMPVENIDAKFEITDISEEGELSVKVGAITLNKKLGGAIPQQTSFLPVEIISSAALRVALHDVANGWEKNGAISPALAQFFRRQAPNVAGHKPGQPLRAPGEDIVAAAVRLVANMQASTLCLQGPPGTGKTTTASFMIKALLEKGKKVGVTSNSHKAIVNLLRSCNVQMEGSLSGIKVGGDGEDPLFAEATKLVAVASSADAMSKYHGGVVAGTAWLFARPEWIGKLDYLFVDEAGQVSVANLAGMSRVTQNIVLLGDQMQLEQPTQGSHPGQSGFSVLNFYLNGHATIPDSLGLFLPESRRMHPEICRFVSDLAYEGRLKAFPGNEKMQLLPAGTKTDLDPVVSGVVFDPVAHDGNVQASEEEVNRIVELSSSLIGRDLVTREGKIRKLTWDDILFVAPYNMQVRKLREHLPAGAKVGSVDKFQGQEAAVVFVSMCSSYGEYGSRGIEFILDQNRMNVAISRAQVLAVVVGDPRIALTPATSIEGMRRLNLYCRLIQECQR
jgi:DNA polymerase III delta prime subunit